MQLLLLNYSSLGQKNNDDISSVETLENSSNNTSDYIVY